MGSCGWLSGGHCEECVHDHAAEGEPHGSTAGGLGRPGALRPGDGRDRAHRGADPLHAGAVPGGFGAAVRVGVQQSGDRQGAEAQHLHRGHAGGPWTEAADRKIADGGLLL